MSVICAGCTKNRPVDGAMQLIPCLHIICQACHSTYSKKSKSVCPIVHCYSPMKLWPEIRWNACENELCTRKMSHMVEVFRTACQHDLCAYCLDEAAKNDPSLCPVPGCGGALCEEDEKEPCDGPCRGFIDPDKLTVLPCCQVRMCAACVEKWTKGKGVCPPSGCIQKSDRKPTRSKKSITLSIKTPCSGIPDCEGEVLRNFPSEAECEHEVCLSCLSKTLDECEAVHSTPVCPNDSCRYPYRCETVLALRALFPEKASFFARFHLESHYSIEALKDDTVMSISINNRDPPSAQNKMDVKICFCEDEENQLTVEFDKTGPLGDFLREIRRVLKIMPTDKVYGYFRRDSEIDKQLDLSPKAIQTPLHTFHITKDTLILVDITGIVNSKNASKRCAPTIK